MTSPGTDADNRALFYWLGLFVAPMLLVSAIYSPQIEPRLIAVAGAFALVQARRSVKPATPAPITTTLGVELMALS